ncbi:MAG: hypothetical protein IPL67_17695 [Ignavibacteria bacterium]|nr:hypothetical protein [Ignavibacteria bacterium]
MKIQLKWLLLELFITSVLAIFHSAGLHRVMVLLNEKIAKKDLEHLEGTRGKFETKNNLQRR